MKYIAIDGRGGSGKTYLSNALAAKLGAAVLHLDDFGNDYEPFMGIPKLIEAIDQQTSDVIIFEGVGVFDERFDKYNSYRLLVNTAADVRKSRAAGRDVPRSDRSAEEWKKIYEIWKEAESKYFTEDIAKKADFVTAEDGEFDLDFILSKLKTVV